MADKKPPEDDTDPRVLKEPRPGKEPPDWEIDDEDDNVWLRGLWMLILALLFELGRVILWVTAILQFLWLLFAREKNEYIADFGKDLADWLARIALYNTGASEDRPFPFAKWGPKD